MPGKISAYLLGLVRVPIYVTIWIQPIRCSRRGLRAIKGLLVVHRKVRSRRVAVGGLLFSTATTRVLENNLTASVNDIERIFLPK